MYLFPHTDSEKSFKCKVLILKINYYRNKGISGTSLWKSIQMHLTSLLHRGLSSVTDGHN